MRYISISRIYLHSSLLLSSGIPIRFHVSSSDDESPGTRSPGEGTVVPSLQSRPGPSSKHNDMMSIVYLSVADARKPACDASLISDINNIYICRSDFVLCMKQSSVRIHEMDGYRDDATLTK